MPAPEFEYIPVVGGKSVLRLHSVVGLSTKPTSSHSHRGRLYASLRSDGAKLVLRLYAKPTRTAGLVLMGECAAAGQVFELAGQGGSGMGGAAEVVSYSGDDDGMVVVPTFAVDADVMADLDHQAALPGYDASYGLAPYHAAAMRVIMASALPAAVPHLFGGAGLAAFVPRAAGDLPDLRKLASVDQLRVAQAQLVKAMAAEQLEHLDEWSWVAPLARKRFEKTMAGIAAANTRDEQTAEEQTPSISVTTFTRG